jgi:hypothetical protein
MKSFRNAIYEESIKELPLDALEVAKKYLAIQKEELLTHLKGCNDDELDFDAVQAWLDGMIFSEDDIAELMLDFFDLDFTEDPFVKIRDMQHDLLSSFDEELIKSFKG